MSEATKGARFAHWTLVRPMPSRKQPTGRWWAACDCGAEREVQLCLLRKGRVRSCGCQQRETLTKHGGQRRPEYNVWMHMRERCRNPRNKRYARYGGRGIRVCERWNDFAAFVADVGPRPSPKHTIDRIDNDGHYEPGNVRWATHHEQVRNRSISKLTALEAVLLRQIWRRQKRHNDGGRQAISKGFV